MHIRVKQTLNRLSNTPRHHRAVILLVIIAIPILTFLTWQLIAWWQIAATLEPKDQIQAKNEALRTAAQVLGATFFLITAYFTWRSVTTAEKNFLTSQEAQLTDRFTKAIEQLGNEKLEIRLGGIYALERIAKDSAKDHWTIMEVLTAYIRENASWKEENHIEKKPPTTDIQAILTVLRRRTTTPEREGNNILNLQQANLQLSDLEKAPLQAANFMEANLKEANLEGADLIRANLIKANLEETNLMGANLEHAYLGGANARKARLVAAYIGHSNLIGANLEKAYLVAANLTSSLLDGVNFKEATMGGALFEKAKLERANFEGATLSTADFTEANLRGANLKGAKLREVNLSGADLSRADLRDADLRGPDPTEFHVKPIPGIVFVTLKPPGANSKRANPRGTNLQGTLFKDALYNNKTQWPDDYIPPADAINTDNNHPPRD